MDSSTAKLHFLDLDNATPDEIQLIDKILYGSTTAVEFPWSLDGEWDGETLDVGGIEGDITEQQQEDDYCQRHGEELTENNVYHEFTEVGGPEPGLVTHLVGVPPACTVPALSPLHGSPLLVSGAGLQPTLVSTSPDPAVYAPVPVHSPMHHAYPMQSPEVIECKGHSLGGKGRRKRHTDAVRNETANDQQHSVMSMPMNSTVPMQQLPQGISYQLTPLQGHLQPHNMATTVTHSYSGHYYPHGSSPAILYTNNPMYNTYVPAAMVYSPYPAAGFMGQTSHMSTERPDQMGNCIVAMNTTNSVQKSGGGTEEEEECMSILPSQEYSSQVPVENEVNEREKVDDGSEMTGEKCIDTDVPVTTSVVEVTTNGCDSTEASSPNEEFIEPPEVVSQPERKNNVHTERPTVGTSKNKVPTVVQVDKVPTVVQVDKVPTVVQVDKVPLIAKVETATTASASPKSWASLFNETNSISQTVVTTTTPLTTPVVVEEKKDVVDNSHEQIDEGVDIPDAMRKDSMPAELGELLSSMQLNHVAVPVVPRGLTNSGNWCYINATLQALLACPPFFNLMRQLPVVAGLKSDTSPIPVIDSMVEFFHEFHPVPPMNKTSKFEGVTKQKDDIMLGTPFEPKYVYQMLRAIKLDSFKGRQEDAEEFLSCILNKLHDEMLDLMASSNSENNELKNGDVGTGGESNHMCDDENDWLVMGHRNKGCVTRSVHSKRSPILEIFGGEMHSMLQQAGASKSATLQPFFTLQLDIQGEGVTCIRTALEGLVTKEMLQGFTCGNTKQEVEASRKITLEKLPTVLILHLKRFVYDRSGGSRKLMKRIDFGMDLELSKDLLSPHGKSNHRQRKFKLFAVVYHDGQDAAKGHYICDVYHVGYRSWLRADDSNIQRVPDSNVLKHAPPRVPYLLYYRNVDTIQ